MKFTALRVKAYVDGAAVDAHKHGGRIVFNWEGPVTDFVKGQAEKRLRVMLSKFDTTGKEGERQLSLLGEAP